MSGPFRFNQEQTLSPLERRNQSPAPDGVSYKTNINRMKTRKWVEAKKNAYDGDDWGDYDEYNEYGAEAEQPQPQPQPAILPGRFEQPSRSFTDPRQARGPAQPGRRNSFDRGDEHRAFSASMAQPPQQYAQQPYGAPRQPPEQIHPAYRQPSAAESDTSDTPQHRRDFNPTALPPPLHTRVAGGDVTSSPSDSYFPPRKSSIGQAESPTATTPRGRAPSNTDKALPFVRPADIYKRYEEDKQRASMDSSRPSMDSLDASAAPPQAPDGPEAGKSLQPLETVAERRSEYLPDLNISTQVSTQAQDKPFLPPVEGIEGISNFAPLTLPDDENFRSVVDQAFTRKDEQRSVPPTPISKSDSSVSRSNTGSTVGISPIMSRVPSGATSALKARNQAGGDTSTPMIVEEASDTGTPVSRPTSANILGATHQIPRKPSPSHSRNHSNTSIPRSGLATPTSVGSPARSPAIEPQKHVPEPETAQLAALSPTSDTATREADIASAMNKNPDLPASQFGVAEKDSQMAFLESHHAQSAVDDALPRSRPESPSKGRVQELAGKFGDVSHSRRGSVQSNASKTSQQSWERSQDNSRPSSPTKASGTTKDTPAARPATEREVSFRPKLPGQWESYATSAATPSEHDQEFGEDSSQTVEDNVSSPLEDVDITPTTEKQLVSVAEPSTADPLMALKAAGTAVAESFQSSVGGGSSQEEPQRNLAHGNVLPRPLQVERTSSSVSTIPPTPPAKDTPEFEDLPPPPPLKPNDQSRRTSAAYTNERPAFVPQLSTDPSAEDQESDRLRKEIVASLTPQRTFATPVVEANAASLQPTDPFPSHENSINPSESQSEHLKTTTEPTGATSLLDRFSWEAHGSNPQGQAQSGTATQSSRGIANEVKLPSPAVEQAAKDHPNESFESVSHSTAVDAEAGVHTPTPPDSARRLGSPVLSSPGLHVVNSADHPEAVEMPLRLSTQVPPISDLPHSSDEKPAVIGDPETPKVTTQAPPLTTTITAAQSPITKSPASDKPLGFRDIINMKSSSERINTYNQTRKYWAHTDHGLGAWVSSAVSANPELATDPYSQPRPVLSSSTTSRHRPTASISLFGKHHGSQQAGPSGAASSQAPSTPASAPTYTGPTRSASHQVQSKGKDLLHTAGLLSGKGMTGAKGLFAKGKSRFGKSDKGHSYSQSEASSREASEEPELISTVSAMPSDHLHLSRISTDNSELREEKKKRRFSSPFHRSSRSRSRPNSVVLPLQTQFDLFGNASKDTAAIVESRPYSYVAPDAWNTMPEDTGQRLQNPHHLGVLPSPAKSAFSLFAQLDREGGEDVPPVPKIPQGVEEGEARAKLHHDTIPTTSTQPAMDASPHGRLDVGRVSPVLSCVGADRLDDDNLQPGHGRLQQPRLSKGDVSPMFPPATLSLDSLDDGTHTHVGDHTHAVGDRRAEYETELIGGDVSPISRQNTMDGGAETDARPFRASPPTEMGGIAVGIIEPSSPSGPAQARADDGAHEHGGTTLTPHAARAAELRPRIEQRLSASRIQVVHAVQYVPSRSQSSFETWDQDSIAAPSDGSPLDEKACDSDIPPDIPPVVPQLLGPSLAEEGAQAAESSTRPNATVSAAAQDEPGQSPRSVSILSKISSMVTPDESSISPASSPGRPRSRPPSATTTTTRPRQVSPAKTSHIPVQIVEESSPQASRSATSNADFDLYADHDGVVKGVHDESGRPLRVAMADSTQRAQIAAPHAPRQQQLTKPIEEEPSRSSEERPMSFISGPRDSNGWPQDQINRPGTATNEPFPPSLARSHRAKTSNGSAYVMSPLAQRVPIVQTNGQSLHQLAPAGHIGSVSSLNSGRSDMKTGPLSTISPPPSSTASPPPLSNRPPVPQKPLAPIPITQNGHLPRVHDSRLMEDPRVMMEAQMRGIRERQSPPQDPRGQGQAFPQGFPMPTPRNQYEAQQQPMTRPAIDPRLHSFHQQASAITPMQPLKKDVKSPSRPKFTSVFKGLGKSHSSSPSPPAQLGSPPPRTDVINSGGRIPSHGSGRRSSSFQSTVGDLQEHKIPQKERRASSLAFPPSRPESLGAESHFSHDSTRVQAAESRLNLRSPDVPIPAIGIPPQQPVPDAAMPLKAEGNRTSTSGVPEPGKKKRFSALGNFFKSKEDKKAQKAQKHTAAPPLQPGHPWPPQQQQHFRPQQHGMQYGQPPAERPFLGMQPVQHPTMLTMPPQGMYRQGVSQQFMQSPPPQGYPQQHMHHPQQGMPQAQQQNLPQAQQHLLQNQQQPVYRGHPAHVYVEQPPLRHQQQPPHLLPIQAQQQPLRQEGSAYVDSRLAHQAHQAQRQPQQPFAQPLPQSHPSSRAAYTTLDHQHQNVPQISGTARVPPEGYYAARETKQSDHRQGIPTSELQNLHSLRQQQEQQIYQAQPDNTRSISKQPVVHSPNAVSPSSQHRASLTNDEPRYETPEIPAAYTHVRPYVSPNLQDPPPDAQQDRHPSPAHYNRQYSEPQMQPLSPQVSAITQAPTNPRSNSETSSVSLVSPISDLSPGIPNPAPASNQRNQKPRMSSITEQTQAERPWNINGATFKLPQGATEQEIVRAQQRQHIEQKFFAQEQLYAERTGRSPSPRSNTTQSPSPRPSQHQSPYQPPQNGGGFREVVPRSSPKPYPMAQALHRQPSDPEKSVLSSHPAQPATVRPGQTSHPATYPPPISPDTIGVRSPVNPTVDSLPPPAPPKSPHNPMFANRPQRIESPHSQRSIRRDTPEDFEKQIPPEHRYQPSPHPQHHVHQQPEYDEHPPTDEPPPYSGLVSPQDVIEKDYHRPPNIVTNATIDDRGQHIEPRQRQVSIAMLQHPQPASMAASPARSSADMGADSLRRQLLEQEERERQERLQRAQTQRAESQREREERERARARARELERSISGGGRVGSLRSTAGSTRTASGWERRRGSSSRPVFELPAEDDEPVMRATSFPGQEWVPTFTED